jgi:DNA-binding NarL/FixJ family response regulator
MARSTQMHPTWPSSLENRTASFFRVLVVDDYEPFRRFVRSKLEHVPSLKVIAEASDGLEAVRKAEELQPELIVLDLGLPGLNGIEAARRILKFYPESKILFLSQESSDTVVQDALSLGALGYVLKAHAGSELVAAANAVCRGRRFVGSGILGNDHDRGALGQVPDPDRGQEIPSLASRNGSIERNHCIEFYPDDASFIVGFADFIKAALKAGSVVIAVVTKAHLEALFQNLQLQGLNTRAAVEGRLIGLDVDGMLSTFMVNDLPDSSRFFRVVGDLIASRTEARDPLQVAVCGECASILWAQGNADGAIQV